MDNRFPPQNARIHTLPSLPTTPSETTPLANGVTPALEQISSFVDMVSCFSSTTVIAPDMWEILQGFANGSQFTLEEVAEQLDECLHQGECRAFAFVLNTVLDMEERVAREKNESYTRVLKLQVPQDWAPRDMDGLQKAFQAIRVQRLELPPNVMLEQAEPVALSHAIAALLRTSSLTDLSIDCVLTSPERVIEAFPHCALTSVSIGRNFDQYDHARMGNAMFDGVAQLLDNLPKCPSLKHLSVCDWEFATLHTHLGGFATGAAGARLESIRLWSGRPMPLSTKDWVDSRCLDDTNKNGLWTQQPNLGDHEWRVDFKKTHQAAAEFMRSVRKIESLKEIAVRGHFNAQELRQEVLEPLENHPNVTRLDIRGMSGNDLGPENESSGAWNAFAQPLEFSLTCPSLTHFTWHHRRRYANSHAVDEVRKEIEAVQDTYPLGSQPTDMEVLSATAVPESVRKTMRDPRFKLKALVYRGHSPSNGGVKTFIEELRTNKTLEYCDFRDTCTDLDAMRQLAEVLRVNRTIARFQMPDSYNCFFVVGKHGGIFGFELDSPGHRGEHDVGDFQLRLRHSDRERDERFSSGLRSEAVDAFKPMRAEASTIYSSVYLQLEMNRREKARLDMTPVVDGFMQSANLNFSGVPEMLARHLLEDHAIGTLVRLSETSRRSWLARPPTPHSALLWQMEHGQGVVSSPPLISDNDDDPDGSWEVDRDLRFYEVSEMLASGPIDTDDVKDVKNSASLREAFRLARAREGRTTPINDASGSDSDSDSDSDASRLL